MCCACTEWLVCEVWYRCSCLGYCMIKVSRGVAGNGMFSLPIVRHVERFFIAATRWFQQHTILSTKCVVESDGRNVGTISFSFYFLFLPRHALISRRSMSVRFRPVLSLTLHQGGRWRRVTAPLPLINLVNYISHAGCWCKLNCKYRLQWHAVRRRYTDYAAYRV